MPNTHRIKMLLDEFLPYLMTGVAVVIGVSFFKLLVFALFWGTLVGLVLYVLDKVKQSFWPSTKFNKRDNRIIDVDTEN